MTEKQLAKLIEDAQIFDANHKILVVKAPSADFEQIRFGFQSLRQMLKNSGIIILFQGGEEVMGCIDLREGKTIHNEFDKKELAKILRKTANLISK